MGLQRALIYLHFMSAPGAVSTLGQGRKCNRTRKAALLELHYTNVHCYVFIPIIVYYIRYHCLQRHHQKSDCKVRSILWYLSQKQRTYDLWRVWIARYRFKEVCKAYLISNRRNILHWLLHILRSTNMCRWKHEQSTSMHNARCVSHSTWIA